MSIFFDKLGRPAEELLGKDFPSDGTVRVVAETKTSNGINIKATANRTQKDGDEKVGVVFEPKYTWASRNIELTGKLTTDNEYEAGVSVIDLAGSGSKFGVFGIQNKKGWSLRPAVEFQNETVAVKASVVYPDDPKSKAIVTEASAVVSHDKNLYLGAHASYNLAHSQNEKDVGAIFSWALRAGYIQSSWQAIGWFKRTPTSNNIGTSYHQALLGAIVGMSFNYDRLAANASPAAAIGCEFKHGLNTNVKTKLTVTPSKDLRLGLAIQQSAWSPSTTITFGADLNALQLLGSNKGDAHTFGIDINLK